MPHGRFRRWLDGFFGEPLRRAASEQREYVNSPEGQSADWQVMVVLFSAALLLTIQEYVFKGGDYGWALTLLQRILPADASAWLIEKFEAPANREISRLLCWGVGQVLIYVVGPLMIILCVLRRPVRDYGVKLRGMLNYAWIYVLMFLAIGPVVIAVSFDKGFLETYPFYRLRPDEPLWPRFVVWEVVYAVQFASLEFFFRGYLLHALRRRFGAYAIFAAMVPYCMIHFQKPVLETMGAIFAGIILGFMSLKTRSVWLGACLHVAVAFTMDAAALWHMGRF